MSLTTLTLFFFGIFSLLSHAISLRVATFNVQEGLDSGFSDTDLEATEAILRRINADIVGLQEVNSNDLNSDGLATFAQNLGYPHIFIPEGALDSQNRSVILSRYPFLPNSSRSIVSPPGANDVTRASAAVTVDVPGTDNDPVIINSHLKCCFDPPNAFRRAVEFARIRAYLEEENLSGSDNLFVMGDYNLIGFAEDFTESPADLPSSFVLGTDITFPVSYSLDPTTFFPGLGIENPGYRQQNGATATFPQSMTGSSGSLLDFILVSSAINDRMPQTEIYRSIHEADFPGLPKSGDPLPFETSSQASDHLIVYGDFELDSGPPLTLTSTAPTVLESSPPLELSVTLPAPATAALSITLSLNDPSEGLLSTQSLTLAPGDQRASFNFIPKRDLISDGSQLIQIRASAPGFRGTEITLEVQNDELQAYTFTALGDPVLEDFSCFEGSQGPTTWSLSRRETWQGLDDGFSDLPGLRSYGNGSLGILSQNAFTFATSIRNDSGEIQNSIEVAYQASQWRRAPNGSRDLLEVSYAIDGIPVTIPELTFTSSLEGPAGPVTPPILQDQRAYLRDLRLAPGETLDLQFTLTPGTSSAPADTPFINEFHYDNSGPDLGEFVEVVIPPDFLGPLSDLILHLYNGNNGRTYGSEHPLTTFTLGQTTDSGFRIYSKEISGIQNGGPDGLALTNGTEVLEFLSYEGEFVATDGPALDLLSLDLGVAQSPAPPSGSGSLALTGRGQRPSELTWIQTTADFTPGSLNPDQTLAANPTPQGLALDNLSITPLLDQDQDLLSDQEELELGTDPTLADTDGDQQSDYFETLFSQTDPLDPTSRFSIDLQILPDGQSRATIPTALGTRYQLETSQDLLNWTPSDPFPGNGQNWSLDFPPETVNFVRARLTRE